MVDTHDTVPTMEPCRAETLNLQLWSNKMFKWKKIGVNKSGQLKPKLSVSMILGYVCLFVAILAMAFLGVGSGSGRGRGGLSGAVAKVDGTEVTHSEFVYAYEGFKRQYSQYGMNLPNLAKFVINMLVEQKINVKLMESAGVFAPKSQIEENVLSQLKAYTAPGESSADVVDKLKKHGITEAQLVQDASDKIIQERYDQVTDSLSIIGDEELKESFNLDYTMYNVSFIKVDPSSVKVNVSDKEVSSYLADENNKSKIKSYYDQNTDKYNIPKKVSIRQILVTHKDSSSQGKAFSRGGEDSDQNPGARLTKEAAKRKATNILKEIQGGKNFDAVAKEKSMDKQSSSKGGFIGFVSKEELPSSIADTVFSLEVGKISDVLESEQGFHIIKVESVQDKVEKSLPDVQTEIARILLEQEKTPTLVKETATKVLADVKAGKTPSSKLSWKDTEEYPMTETDIPGIGNSDSVREAIFTLKTKGSIYNDLVSDRDSFYILKLKSIKIPTDKDFDKEKATYKQKLTSQKKNYILSTVREQYREDMSKKIWTNPAYLALDNQSEAQE